MKNLAHMTTADLAQAMQDEVAHLNALLKELRLIRLQETRSQALEDRENRHTVVQRQTSGTAK